MVSWASVGLARNVCAMFGRAGTVMSTASGVIEPAAPRMAMTAHEVGAGRLTAPNFGEMRYWAMQT